MSTASETLVSPEELAAAQAEVEQHGAPDDPVLPSLDEGAATAFVSVPHPTHEVGGAAETPTPPPAAPAAASASATIKPTTSAKPAAAGATAAPVGGSGGKLSVGRFLYWLIDTLLDWINWPFMRLSEGVRGMIGTIAVATIVVSALAMLILPMLHPNRDPIAFLKAKEAAAAAAAPADAHGAPAKDAGHGGGH